MTEALRTRRRFRPFARWLAGEPPACEQLTATTSDGVLLSLRRVRPQGVAGKPVLLVHGLASSGVTFHFPERSLAAYLAARGFDCFIPDLRGAGDSDVPERRWDLHDYLAQD